MNLTANDITNFIKEFDLKLSYFNEEMRAAIGTPTSESNQFTYTLQDNFFNWKKFMGGTTFAKLGRVRVQEVMVTASYEEMVDKLLDKLSSIQENFSIVENENISIKTDRDKALAKMKKIASEKEEWEKTLYGQFIAILNAKKEKILALEEELEFRNSENSQGSVKLLETDTTRDDLKGEQDEDNPYEAATDVDTDPNSNEGEDQSSDWDRTLSPEPKPQPSSSALRRHRDMFESFDSSPGSPAPVLPKRARMPASEHSVEVAEAGPSQEHTTSAVVDVEVVRTNVTEEDKGEDSDDMDHLTLGEDTQDLLADF
ncbi:uncharacterized protein LOC113217716 isoform X2 [Frankliniella occidentalis]|uniref:Uncharacterized protein LOC113217716 isoform X2 n=1 Tax=Frankliniella occidentalis TaxID=133901 RepID=A0A9C6U0K7_FRAOC|nr:uncharacterized protein LOC113217716 isoform X2 [Frankliniella occidentalis]